MKSLLIALLTASLLIQPTLAAGSGGGGALPPSTTTPPVTTEPEERSTPPPSNSTESQATEEAAQEPTGPSETLPTTPPPSPAKKPSTPVKVHEEEGDKDWDPTMSCNRFEKRSDRITCRLQKTPKELEEELKYDYNPEGCRRGKEWRAERSEVEEPTSGGDETEDGGGEKSEREAVVADFSSKQSEAPLEEEWQNECKNRYQAVAPCWIFNGQDRLNCAKEKLNLPKLLLPLSKVCDKNDNTCKENYKNAIHHFIVFKFYQVEEEAEKILLQKRAAGEETPELFQKGVKLIDFISASKINFYNAKSKTQRKEIIRNVSLAWKTFLASHNSQP